jgi:hypothetical protein
LGSYRTGPARDRPPGIHDHPESSGRRVFFAAISGFRLIRFCCDRSFSRGFLARGHSGDGYWPAAQRVGLGDHLTIGCHELYGELIETA